MKFLNSHIQDIHLLCKHYKVKQLYAFGSVLNDKFNPDSDIDLMVNFKPIDVLDYADNYFDLKFSLEQLLRKPVDLLEQGAIKNPYFLQAVARQKQLIYG